MQVCESASMDCEHLILASFKWELPASQLVRSSIPDSDPRKDKSKIGVLGVLLGSVYILVLIAAFSLRTLCSRHISAPGLEAFGNLLKTPDSYSTQVNTVNLIKSKLLPLLGKLRSDISSLRVPTFLSSRLSQSLNLGENFYAGDICSSDKFFNSFFQQSVLLIQRDATLWESIFPSNSIYPEASRRLDSINSFYLRATGNLSSSHETFSSDLMPWREGDPASTDQRSIVRSNVSSCRSSLNILNNDNFVQFPIPFRFTSNTKVPYPKTHEPQLAWTDEERKKALKALEPSSLEEFRKKVQANFNDKGLAKKGGSWIKLKRELIKGKEIQVNGEDGIVFNIDGTMPEHLKANLLESLNLALRGYSKEDQLTENNTSDNPTFTALHFSYYSKYGTEGTFVPKDIHPHKLKNKNTTRTNHSQFLTRESADMRDHPEQYRQICDALELVLRWVVEKRLKRHPDLFSEIEGEVDIYPLNDTNPVHPFSSFVINLNVKTQAHRDGGDKNGCIVLVLGDHIGGGVCLETGSGGFPCCLASSPMSSPTTHVSETIPDNDNSRFLQDILEHLEGIRDGQRQIIRNQATLTTSVQNLQTVQTFLWEELRSVKDKVEQLRHSFLYEMDPEVESASIQANVFPEGSEYLPVVIGPGTDRLRDIGPETDNLGDVNSNEVLSGVNGAFTPPRGATTPRAATSSPLAVYRSLPAESSPRESRLRTPKSQSMSSYSLRCKPPVYPEWDTSALASYLHKFSASIEFKKSILTLIKYLRHKYLYLQNTCK
ncbi:hypothetical protein K435DRAFT_800160 [Dendrothele bispora CBS 962.96]|uniref:Uncharacterized protein n=1 Tax=Dendrothele bispora (strain CBS 962.96) TaxID=1314807 RepID=A0A4S8LUA1_DENBC|nr:hypothetical protein K435DRAFT_800160 [Dendrothele bispora CBS 962.96]